MQHFRFNYIITIHNKEDLIEQVLEGVISSCRENSYVYPVLDGCTDKTEQVIDMVAARHPNVVIEKIYAPDVHEIRSINIALRSIPQNEQGCNIILQDDVVLKEPNLETVVKKIYDHIGYEKVGCIAFRHGVNMYADDVQKTVEERDLVECVYGTGMSSYPLMPGRLLERMVVVRSPECISCEVVSKVGVMDEQLAPYTYDNHDISLRCLQAGYKNFVFGLPFVSDIKWGGTRTNPHPEFNRVINRNKHYLYEKHRDFLHDFEKSKEFARLKKAESFTVPGLAITDTIIPQSIAAYHARRKMLVGRKYYFVTKYIKEPIKKILVKAGLY